MMIDTDKWQEIYATLRTNKLRTALTALGVFWGIFMLIVMMAAGRGLESGVSRSMGRFATNSVAMWGRRTSLPHRGMQPGRRIEFRNADVDAIRTIPGIARLAPRNQFGGWRGGATVKRGTRTGGFSVMGDYPDIYHIELVDIARGRALDHLDIAERRKVAVIGRLVADELFAPGEDPIGGYIQIAGVYFQVVGVTESRQTGDAGERSEQMITIPFTTFQQAFHYGDRVGWIAVTARPHVKAGQLERDIKALLAERHKVHPDDDQAIGSFNAEETFGKVSRLFAGIRAIVWFVGIVTLLAGAIGVSNIMLIAVKERTREIGVRKALGATPASIVSLIVQESVLLTTLAGCLGVMAGVGTVELVRTAMARFGVAADMFADPRVDVGVVLVATAILVVAGALAGVIPGYHAARIDPVHALKSE